MDTMLLDLLIMPLAVSLLKLTSSLMKQLVVRRDQVCCSCELRARKLGKWVTVQSVDYDP